MIASETVPVTGQFHPGSSRYTRTAIAFHWLLALMITASFAFGLYMVELPFSPARIKQYNWHKWAGITILGLSAMRLLWRLGHPPPAHPLTLPAWKRLASAGTHASLYVLFFGAPIAGWAYSSAAGFPVVYLGLFQLPDLVSRDKELADILKLVHQATTYSLAAMVGLHAIAALKHHFIDRDGLLQRVSLFHGSSSNPK